MFVGFVTNIRYVGGAKKIILSQYILVLSDIDIDEEGFFSCIDWPRQAIRIILPKISFNEM